MRPRVGFSHEARRMRPREVGLSLGVRRMRTRDVGFSLGEPRSENGKRLSSPSTTASEFARSGITSGEWAARIEPKQLMLLDVGYVVDNVLPPFQGEQRVVFLAILAVARMVIWETWKKGLYDDANFSHRDLVLYFRHQLKVKIRCDRKRLDRITFDKRWVNAVGLVVRKAAILELSFPPLLTHGVYGTPPRVNRERFFPSRSLVSSMLWVIVLVI